MAELLKEQQEHKEAIGRSSQEAARAAESLRALEKEVGYLVGGCYCCCCQRLLRLLSVRSVVLFCLSCCYCCKSWQSPLL